MIGLEFILQQPKKNNEQVTYEYVTKGDEQTGSVSITSKSLSLGTLYFRYIRGSESFASCQVEVGPEVKLTVSTTKPDVVECDLVVVSGTLPPKAWIGIYNKDETNPKKKYINFEFYANNKISFANVKSGDYVCRLCHYYEVISTSAEFHI